MRTKFIITQRVFEKLKQKARKLKKSSCIPHHEALDLVARDFCNDTLKQHSKTVASAFLWKHICEDYKETRLAEEALNTGFVVIADPKDVDGYPPVVGKFEHDLILPHLCIPRIKDLYMKNALVENEEEDIQLSADELNEYFLDDYGFLVFYRYSGEMPSDIDAAVDIYFKEFFFPPQYTFFNGKLIEYFGSITEPR